MTTTVAEFKTTLKLCTLVSILEEIDDRRRGKTSRGEFSSVILEGGLPLSDQQEIKIMKTASVAPSERGLPTDSPEVAPAIEEAVAPRTTTTPHKESNQEEVEVS
jgi:hypothetical protein